MTASVESLQPALSNDWTLDALHRPQSAPEFIRQWISWGAGPRASQYLVLGAKTRAALRGRLAPGIEDVQAVAPAVLRHRIVTNFTAEAEGIKPDRIVADLLKTVPTE